MITLYQMPISHYSEKIRWALNFKCLPHKYKNLLPGLHIRPVKRMTGQSSVPVIKESGRVIHGSAAIIDYLDSEFPRFTLTPTDENERKQAQTWEQYADEKVGPAVRVLAYSILLDRPGLLKPAMAQGGPWYGSIYMNKAFPKIKTALEKGYKIDEQSAEAAKRVLHQASDKFCASHDANKTILDSGFSRADLALAALWAPLFNISKFGISWQGELPPSFVALAEEFSDMKPWVEHIYSKFR